MANEEEKGNDFYAVLGLNKECTDSELRNAYKKLALKWHPDRCSASGNSKHVEEAKEKFQDIQQAYSVLSDANKRWLYDMGVYDNEDDGENGMGDFLNEMVAMMSQTKPNENDKESLEELQQLFEEMFQGDIVSSEISSHSHTATAAAAAAAAAAGCSSSNKRNSTEMNFGKADDFSHFNFCLGVENLQDQMKDDGRRGIAGGGRGGSRNGYGSSSSSKRRHGRKQKVSSGHDVSSNEYSGISA